MSVEEFALLPRNSLNWRQLGSKCFGRLFVYRVYSKVGTCRIKQATPNPATTQHPVITGVIMVRPLHFLSKLIYDLTKHFHFVGQHLNRSEEF